MESPPLSQPNNQLPEERQGLGTYTHGGPNEFIACTDSAHLLELPSLGGDFTWNNNSLSKNFIQSKIDGAFTCQEWISKWPNSRMEFFRGLVRDHTSVTIVFSNILRGTRSIKIYNSCLDKPKFISLAKQCLSTPIHGNSMFRLQKKIQKVNVLAKNWAQIQGRSTRQEEDARLAQDRTRLNLLEGPSSVGLQNRAKEMQ